MKKIRYVLVGLLVILDQLVKYIIRANMTVSESIDVIPSIFSITYVRNFGAAFGSMENKTIILKFAPIVLIILLIIFLEKYINSHNTLIYALLLIIAGGIGNLIDRWVLGYVTDMFDFHFWPVFNVADILVCVGCGLLLLYVIVFEKKEHSEK